MIDLLIILLIPALKAVEGGSRNPAHWLCAVVVGLVDVVIAHTTWVLVTGHWPKRGEWTVSKALERLCLDYDHKNWTLYCSFAKYINRQSPTRNHIKAVL